MSSLDNNTGTLSEGGPAPTSSTSDTTFASALSSSSARSSATESASPQSPELTSPSSSLSTSIATGAVEGSTGETAQFSGNSSTTATTASSAGGQASSAAGNATGSDSGASGSSTTPTSSSSFPAAALPTDKGAAFNSTVAITLNSTSPMINMENMVMFRIDPNTGYRIYEDRQSGDNPINFVGVAYGLNGTARYRPGYNASESVGPGPAWNRLTTVDVYQSLELLPMVNSSSNLGEMKNLNLSRYAVELTYGVGAYIEFHNATFHIPIKTQAPNFTAMQSQAKTLSVTQDGGLSPYVDLTSCSVIKELNEANYWPPRVFEWTAFGAKYDVIDEYLLLRNSTELVYQVAPNTTLIEVLGPVGAHPQWLGDSECYAHLNPRPSWWLRSNFPLSSSAKPVNATNQTVFLLPVDPEIAFELRVGGLGRETACPISAIRTYPFHYDFNANVVNATGSSPGATGSSPGATVKKSSSTPIIVGVVVGVGGGLILLALAYWLFRRHQKKRAELEEELLPNPFSGTEQPRSKAELERMARGEEPRGPDGPNPPDQGATQPNEEEQAPQRGHRIVHEMDGQSIVEYLPPLYGDIWPRGQGEPQHPGSSEANPADAAGPSRPLPAPEMAEHREPAPRTAAEDPAVADKLRDIRRDRPWLKQQYARAFGRALPKPPSSASASGSQEGMIRQPEADTSLGAEDDLRAAYKRRFAASSSEGQESPSSSGDSPPERDSPVRPASAGPGGEERPQGGFDMSREYEKWFK